MIAVQPPPKSLVDERGRVRFGVYSAPLPAPDLGRARLHVGGLPLPGALARFRLKEWDHVLVVTPELAVGFAVVDTKFLRATWCHVVRRTDGSHFEHARKGLTLDLHVAEQLFHGDSWVKAPGYHIGLGHRLESGVHEFSIDVAAAAGKPAVRASLAARHDLAQIDPLVVVLPVGANRGMYSHKVALPLAGSLTVGEATVTLDPGECAAILDIHKAHYPHRTFWKWATFVGRSEDGRSLALNLTQNVNRHDARFNENAVWVDGRIHHLGPASFEFERGEATKPWRIRTSCGGADLTFTPEGERHEDTRLGLVQSVFRQPYGCFTGTVQVGGTRYTLCEAFGVCEDHEARW